MFRRTFIVAAATASALALSACANMSSDPDIVDIAAGNDDFSTLVAAVSAAGLVETLKSDGPFTVFAPNNANTWVRVRSMIENFLTVQWRNGALVGPKPEDAFNVRVGLNQTMTNDDILNGLMKVRVGLAIVRHLVVAMGGSVEAESELGKGTTICFTVPAK